MIRSRYSILPAAVMLGATVLVAGCSSDSGTTTTSSSTAATQSSAAEAPANMDGADLAARMLAATQKAGTVKYTTTSTSGSVETTTESEAVYSGDKVSASVTISGASAMQMISIDNASKVYIKSEPLQMPKWTLVEASSSNPVIKAIATQLDAMKGSLDPSTSIKLFDQAGDFTNAGKETVDGVETTKYTGKMPTSALASLMGDLASAVPSTGTDPIDVQVFLDKDDRPIKITQKGTFAGQAIDSTVNYSGYGSDIKVVAPAVGS